MVDSPDYQRGIIDGLKLCADCAQTMIERRRPTGEAEFLLTALRDGYAAAALLAGLEITDAPGA